VSLAFQRTFPFLIWTYIDRVMTFCSLHPIVLAFIRCRPSRHHCSVQLGAFYRLRQVSNDYSKAPNELALYFILEHKKGGKTFLHKARLSSSLYQELVCGVDVGFLLNVILTLFQFITGKFILRPQPD
jgi:hypothetical protein